MGDPIELAAIRSLGWTFDAPSSTAYAADPVPKLEQALKTAEANLAAAKKKASAPQAQQQPAAGAPGGPSQVALELKKAANATHT